MIRGSDYTLGSGIGQHQYGRKLSISDLPNLKVGQLFIEVNHQFTALNVCFVTKVLPNRFYVRFFHPQKGQQHHRYGCVEESICVWDFTVEHGFNNYYFTEAVSYDSPVQLQSV